VIEPDPYHGTGEAAFGKDWVFVDGKLLNGISHANPASGAKVAILYSEGGRDVPAAELPQGFLDAWQITPAKLKTADAQ